MNILLVFSCDWGRKLRRVLFYSSGEYFASLFQISNHPETRGRRLSSLLAAVPSGNAGSWNLTCWVWLTHQKWCNLTVILLICTLFFWPLTLFITISSTCPTDLLIYLVYTNTWFCTIVLENHIPSRTKEEVGFYREATILDRYNRLGIGNMVPSKWCCTAIPTVSEHWTCWQGLMGVVAQWLLQETEFATPELYT